MLSLVGITWLDAPQEQFARVDTDHKIRCKVQANPAANIDWLKESVVISSGEIYVSIKFSRFASMTVKFSYFSLLHIISCIMI